MNEYRITYTDGTGSEFFCNITERTEADAKKSFKTWNKKLGHTLQGVELLRTGVNATKQQERDTLEAIRKMVEELGPQSYLATAFEGCFEIAEQNIEFDFADSMKGRLESAEKKLQDEKDAHEATNHGQVFTITRHPRTGNLCIDWRCGIDPIANKGSALVPLTSFAWTVVFENIENGKLYHNNEIGSNVVELTTEHDKLRRACAAGIS